MTAVFPVGVIGVGNMGGAMAARLAEFGWAPWVHDIDASKVANLLPFGALTTVDIEQAATNSIATIVCVVDVQQTRDVLFGPQGIAQSLPAGNIVVLCPTIAPDDVERIAAELQTLGVDTVDAPMSGGPARARDGSMSLMVACSDAVFARCQPLLDALSSKVFHVSQRVGDGARTKLVNNLLAGINLVGAAEVMALASRMRRAIAVDLVPRAHMTLLTKDTRLAIEAAQVVGFDGPLGAKASQVFAQAVQAGLAELDDAALLGFLQRP